MQLSTVKLLQAILLHEVNSRNKSGPSRPSTTTHISFTPIRKLFFTIDKVEKVYFLMVLNLKDGILIVQTSYARTEELRISSNL